MCEMEVGNIRQIKKFNCHEVSFKKSVSLESALEITARPNSSGLHIRRNIASCSGEQSRKKKTILLFRVYT